MGCLNKMSRKTVIALLCICVFFLILLHQFLVYGSFLELKDVLHHEFFAFLFLAFGAGVLFSEGLE